MKVRFLSVVAAAALLAACESTPDSDAAAGGSGAGAGAGGDSVTVDQGAVSGVEPGSQADLVATVGDRVFFGFDKYNLTDEARATLKKQAAWLQKYPDVEVVVEGHADERGTREYNLALGERRANSVRDYLIALGVSPDRITTISYGKERPVALGSNEAAWAQNRRAVTVVQ